MKKFNGPFQIISSKRIHGNHWLSLRVDKVIRPGGKRGVFGVLNIMDGTTVLPLDDDNNVYLVKEYKYALARESLELVSGGVEEGEGVRQAAKRELLEESGLAARKLIAMGRYNALTSVVKIQSHLFLALGVRAVAEPNPDEGEIISTIKVPFARAVKMALAGGITHLPSCFLILKAERYLNGS